MPNYQVNVTFKAESDEAAKTASKAAARAVNGKVDKLLSERLAFRSLSDEAAS